MEFEIYRENDARFHWRLIGDDGTRLAVSAVTFSSAEMARRAVDEVRGQVGSATGTRTPTVRGRATPQPTAERPSREFSANTMQELLRALHARAVEHPDSPALIASWPGVPEGRMPGACAELQRQGYAVREVAIILPGGKERRGWMVEGTADGVTAPAEWSDASATASSVPESNG
jgi:uncharacterized protein YegP (UPF0339 family)